MHFLIDGQKQRISRDRKVLCCHVSLFFKEVKQVDEDIYNYFMLMHVGVL